MTRHRLSLWLIAGIAFFSSGAHADGLEYGGHIKPRYNAQTFPGDSLIGDLAGSTTNDLTVDTRIVLGYDRGGWDLRADYQFDVFYGDTIEYTRQLPEETEIFFNRLPNDRRRLFDLTHVFHDENKTAVLHRLDRLSVGYSGENYVVRFGRQTVSWGNGMIYTPMDIFNPFDPATVDTEYKTGDDMFYGQYLRANGDDLQTVAVFRRDVVSGDFQTRESSLAFKYHGRAGDSEYDVLAADHYDDILLAAGGNTALGGAIWRGDVTLSFADQQTIASAVTSLSYSWTWAGRNISGVAEYFFNGFGQRNGRYDPGSLAGNPDLLARVARRELFTLARHYVALSAMIEITPLFILTPNVFINASDQSALLQIVTQNDLRENLTLLGAINVPVGPDGTEFGGIETRVPGRFLSTGPSLFLQLAWYF